MSNDTNHAPATESGTPPTVDPPEARAPLSARTDAELARELHEFGKQFPEPRYGDANADALWFEEHLTELHRQYLGYFVAIYNQAVVGHGKNALQLQLDVARKLNIHPDRLIVEPMYSLFS